MEIDSSSNNPSADYITADDIDRLLDQELQDRQLRKELYLLMQKYPENFTAMATLANWQSSTNENISNDDLLRFGSKLLLLFHYRNERIENQKNVNVACDDEPE